MTDRDRLTDTHCLSVCLCVCFSVRLSVCLSVFLFVCLSVCLSDCLSVCLSVSVCAGCWRLETGGRKPEKGGRKLRAGGREARCKWPEAGGRKPKAAAFPGAGSRKPEAKSRKLEARNRAGQVGPDGRTAHPTHPTHIQHDIQHTSNTTSNTTSSHGRSPIRTGTYRARSHQNYLEFLEIFRKLSIAILPCDKKPFVTGIPDERSSCWMYVGCMLDVVLDVCWMCVGCAIRPSGPSRPALFLATSLRPLASGLRPPARGNPAAPGLLPPATCIQVHGLQPSTSGLRFPAFGHWSPTCSFLPLASGLRFRPLHSGLWPPAPASGL